jgi:hypothetical protein
LNSEKAISPTVSMTIIAWAKRLITKAIIYLLPRRAATDVVKREKRNPGDPELRFKTMTSI